VGNLHRGMCLSIITQSFACSPIFSKVVVGSLNDRQKERQFRILNDEEERGVKIVRCGAERVVGVKELLVGAIALLEHGEIVPCDGIFMSGHNVKCDESGATGESDAIERVGYGECVPSGNKSSAGVSMFIHLTPQMCTPIVS